MGYIGSHPEENCCIAHAWLERHVSEDLYMRQAFQDESVLRVRSRMLFKRMHHPCVQGERD